MKLIYLIIVSFVFSSCPNENYSKLINEQNKSLESGYELIDKNLTQLKKEVFYLLSDEAKRKYRPIKGLIEKTSINFLEIYNWIDIQKKLKDSFLGAERMVEIDSLLEKLKSTRQDDFIKILNEHGKTFGLRGFEIIEWIDENNTKLNSIDTISNFILKHRGSNKTFHNILVKTKYDLKVLENKLIGRMAELTGGRGIYCNFGIFPRVFSNQNVVKRGEVFKAEIALHPYDHGIFLSDLEIKVDGEIVDFSDGRYIKYISEPILGKKGIILITGKRRSEITGKFETAFPDYEYIINTIE